MLKPQLFIIPEYIDVYDPSYIAPVQNSFVKPDGGLWTSTYEEETMSPWVKLCGDLFGMPDIWNAVLLTPKADARLLVIDCYDDLHAATEKYPFDPYGDMPAISQALNTTYLDFESIAKEYDGVHLTQEGQWATRMTHPYKLYGWDIESTIWFRDVFESVKEMSFPSSHTLGGIQS